MNRHPRYAIAVAIFLGLVAAALPASLPSSSFAMALLISAAVFGCVGLILGRVWPGLGWKWGLWVIAPGLVLVVTGVLSSGEYESFFRDDLPFLAAGLVTASVAGLVGARLSPGSRSAPRTSAD